LEDLHEIIQRAFNFANDHMYAFFMDNELWSDDAYLSEITEPFDEYASGYTLAEFDFVKGNKFKYVFDFGDGWIFQCKVLGTNEETPEKPVIIKSKGKAPEQYPDWDGED
jgi:hypothetical protein